MRRLTFLLVLLFPLFLASEASAQLRFGYLSYQSVLRQMPDYAEVQKSVTDLRAKYEQEATRGEEEFQRKFSEFLQGQKDFPENILLKRQAELQNLMEAGIKFRQEAVQIVDKAERELMGALEESLNATIQAIGLEAGYAAILNTDNNQCPFINPALGDDITLLVLRQLGVEQAPVQPEPQEPQEAQE